MKHSASNNENRILYYQKDKKTSKPVIPVEMSAHIFKRMREAKEASKDQEKEKIVFFPPYIAVDETDGDIFLTETSSNRLNNFKGDFTLNLTEEVLSQKPFMRRVIYLTNDTLAEAFELLNRVSASRLLFDSEITVNLHEDKEKSLWYLEVIT